MDRCFVLLRYAVLLFYSLPFLLVACGGRGGGGGVPVASPTTNTPDSSEAVDRASGTLMLGVQGVPRGELAELWVTVTHVAVESEAGIFEVFPPADSPDAEKRVDLLSFEDGPNIVSIFDLPADAYRRVLVKFDGVFARRGRMILQVIPDAGDLEVQLTDTPLLLKEATLTPATLEFDLRISASENGTGTFRLEPVLDVIHLAGDETTEVRQFRGTVAAIQRPDELVTIDVTAQQKRGDVVVVGQIPVHLDDETLFKSSEVEGGEISFIEEGDNVEVDGVLYESGILAVELDVRGPTSLEDLNDNGTEDVFEFPDHDTDIDNDGIPNRADVDDDGDGVRDEDDDDADNDGVPNILDLDDDDDGVPDDRDADDDGDGIDDEADTDHADREIEDGEPAPRQPQPVEPPAPQQPAPPQQQPQPIEPPPASPSTPGTADQCLEAVLPARLCQRRAVVGGSHESEESSDGADRDSRQPPDPLYHPRLPQLPRRNRTAPGKAGAALALTVPDRHRLGMVLPLRLGLGDRRWEDPFRADPRLPRRG